MGTEHAGIHIETSSALIRQLPIEEVVQIDFWEINQEWRKASKNELLSVSSGEVKMRKLKDHSLFIGIFKTVFGKKT